MSDVQNHRDLDAWHVAMDLVMETYDLTACFPSKELYGLQSQMRRAAVSVPSNIAEGQARPLQACINHLSISAGSLAELDTHVEIALRRRYLTETEVDRFRTLHESSRRLVFGLMRSKRRSLATDAVGKAGVFVLLLYALSHVVR